MYRVTSLFGARRRFLARSYEHVFPGLGHRRDFPLPHIMGSTTNLAFRHVHDPRLLTEIDEHQRVRRSGIEGQPTQDVIVAIEENNLAVFGTERHVVGVLPLRHRDQRDCPDVGLARALEIDLVEQLVNGFVGRISAGEVVREAEFADTCIKRFLGLANMACTSA